MTDNVYYVYLHRRGDNNEVFYVGKGKKRRAYTSYKRSGWWTNVAKKYGFVVEFVEMGLSEDDALDLEVETIKFYRENGHELCNLTNGGEGASGYKHTAEYCAKMKVRMNTEEAKRHVTATRGRRVLCSNGMEFDSGRMAAAWLRAETGTFADVSSCCNRLKSQTGDLVWRWLDDCDDLRAVLDAGLDAYEVFGGAEKSKSFKPKPVECVCNGLQFPSAYAAAHWLKSVGYPKATNTQVLRCCNLIRETTYGFKFKYI